MVWILRFLLANLYASSSAFFGIKCWSLVQLCWIFCIASAFGSSLPFGELNSKNIARNALEVAETTQSSGYCYAAVTKAVRPLGVQLSGASAYMARDLLLTDDRFIAIEALDPSMLRVGDIIVYNATSRHPHGHIAVYEGFGTEASDHISALTSFAEYGGATIFRLKDEQLLANQDASANEVIQIAPDFRRPLQNSSALNERKSVAAFSPQSLAPPRTAASGIKAFLGREKIKVLKSKLIRLMIQTVNL